MPDEELIDDSSSVEIEYPIGYRFEPEFDGALPREIPEALSRPHRRLRRNAGIAIFGSLAILFPYSIALRHAATVAPILDHSFWMVGALSPIIIWGLLSSKLRFGDLEYIRSGRPHVGLIVDVALQPVDKAEKDWISWEYLFHTAVWRSSESTPVFHRFRAVVPGSELSTTMCTYRMGDSVTVVDVPESRKHRIELYGLTGVRSDIGLVRRVRSPFWLIPAGLVAPFVGLALMATMGSSASEPVDRGEGWLIGWVLGALLIGAPVSHWLNRRRREREADNSNAVKVARAIGVEIRLPRSSRARQWWIRVIVYAMSAVIGGMTTMGANAFFDDSKGVWRPVVIEELLLKTQQVFFQEFIVEFRFTDTGSRARIHTTPRVFEKLKGHRGPAFAEVHDGALGIKWVRVIEIQMPEAK